MSNVELVIKIPEENYKRLVYIDMFKLRGYIENGVVLPKGHGDLIDRNDILADSYCIDDWSGNEVNIVDVMTVKMTDAIIKADKKDEEDGE